MYEITASDPKKQAIADLLTRVIDREFGEDTPIGNALTGVVRDLYFRDFMGEELTEVDVKVALEPILEMARERYGDINVD